MQDNLEFLQWSKKFWDQYFPGGDYDALGRRKGSAAPPPTTAPSSRTSTGTTRRGATPTGVVPRARMPAGGGNTAALQQENATLKESVTGLERERDFYFSKLRDIELLIQRAVDADPELEKDEEGLVKPIQNILYSTEVRGMKSPSQEKTTVQVANIWLSLPRKGSRFQQKPSLRTILRLSDRLVLDHVAGERATLRFYLRGRSLFFCSGFTLRQIRRSVYNRRRKERLGVLFMLRRQSKSG